MSPVWGERTERSAVAVSSMTTAEGLGGAQESEVTMQPGYVAIPSVRGGAGGAV